MEEQHQQRPQGLNGMSKGTPPLVAPQPWQGPHMPAHPQQRYVERTGPNMQLGWKPVTASGSKQVQEISQNQTHVNSAGRTLPPPQFHVTANVTLTGSNSGTENFQGGRMGATCGNISSGGANAMSFNILVQTNFPATSSGSSQPSNQGQFCQSAPQHPGVVHGTPSSDVLCHSPVPSTSQAPVPHFVQSFDPSLHPPPAYAPVPRRPFTCSDVSMSETTSNWQNNPSCFITITSSSSSSRTVEALPGTQKPHQTLDPSVMKCHGLVHITTVGLPSPLSDSSLTIEGPTKVTNQTGTVVYRLDSPNSRKRPPIPTMDGQESRLPTTEDDDQMSESDMEMLTPGQRYKQFREKNSKLKKCSPAATKFLL